MAFVDPTYTYRAANQAYCDEHRRTLEEIVGHTVTEVFGKETFEGALKPHLDRCLKGEHVSFGFWWTSPSRGRRHVEARYDPSYEADGSLSGVAVNVRDTTERKRIEEEHERSLAELETANRELELFSASLAHDLRNPLLIVTNFSANLEEELGDSLEEPLRDDLRRIRGAGQHMMHILEDLRDLADVSRGEINREDVDLSSLAQEIMDDMRAVIPDHDVTFEAEPGIIAVGDKTLIRILLSNLLQNAWKYTRPCDDPRIELGVEEHESIKAHRSLGKRGSMEERRSIAEHESITEHGTDGPIYYVRDNGIGFENADGEVIFRAFERLHTKREFPGSGLGLATVERIIRRHGGRVWAEGTPGKGATFRFTFAAPSGDDRRHEQGSRDA
jgi:PAS domain S-box-containing protein